MTEYEYDYKRIFEEIEKYIDCAREAVIDELANKKATVWERCESYGKYSALACIRGRLAMLKKAHRREVKNERLH